MYIFGSIIFLVSQKHYDNKYKVMKLAYMTLKYTFMYNMVLPEYLKVATHDY